MPSDADADLAHDSHLTHEVIGLAMRLHRTLGPGLLESIYEDCRLSGCPIGLLLNFNCAMLKEGIRRFVN